MSLARQILYTLTLRDRATGAVQSFRQGLEDANRAAREASGFAEALNRSWASLGDAAGAAAAWADGLGGVAGALDSVTGPGLAFDTAMRRANTMAGKGAAEFGRMKDAVRALAAEIPLTREQLARGLYETISNGVEEGENFSGWLDMLRASARSAVGGCADLGQIVGVTSTILKNYASRGYTAAEVQDKIQKTAQSGVTSFEQLAAALPRVTGMAANLNIGIDDLLASFATLTGVSGNTAEVSTQLGAIFGSLVKPSSEAAKMADEMGMKFDSLSVARAGGLVPYFRELSGRVSEYAEATGQEAASVYSTLFGSAEAVRAILPIVGELGEKFAENQTAMREAAGTMDFAYGQMAGAGGGILQGITNKWDNLKDSLYDATAAWQPWIKAAADGAKECFGLIGAAGGLFESVGKTREGLRALGPALTRWAGTLWGCFLNNTLLGRSLSAAAAAMGLKTAAAEADTAAEGANTAAQGANTAAQGANTAARGANAGAADAQTGAANANTRAANANTGATRANAASQGLLGRAMTAARNPMKALRAGFGLLCGGVRAFTATLLANPIGLIAAGVTLAIVAVKELWERFAGFRAFLLTVFDVIKMAFGAAWEWVKELWEGFAGWLGRVWEGVKSVWGAVSETVKSAARTVWGFVEPIIKKIASAVRAVTDTIAAGRRLLMGLAGIKTEDDGGKTPKSAPAAARTQEERARARQEKEKAAREAEKRGDAAEAERLRREMAEEDAREKERGAAGPEGAGFWDKVSKRFGERLAEEEADQKIRDKQKELEEAEDSGDAEKAERLRRELREMRGGRAEGGKASADPAANPPGNLTGAIGASAARGAAEKARAGGGTTTGVKQITINIDKIVEAINIHAQTVKESPQRIRDIVAEALAEAVNDAQLAF